MKIKITLSKNTTPCPFNYQEKIVGKFHGLLGNNDIHDSISLYSISMLTSGGKVNGGNLNFPMGTSMYISFYDISYLQKIINGITENPYFPFGMVATSIEICQINVSNKNEYRFRVTSPVLIKDIVDDNTKHLLFNDKTSSEVLTRIMKRKLTIAGLSDDVEVSFDKAYKNPKTKLITYKGISNKCTIAPIIVKGSPEILRFAYDVGVGNSTGIGFGCLI